MNYQLFNRTTHLVSIYSPSARRQIDFQPEGIAFQVDTEVEQLGTITVDVHKRLIATFDLCRSAYTHTYVSMYNQLTNKWLPTDKELPFEREGVLYIVSSVVWRCNPQRRDLVVPGESVWEWITLANGEKRKERTGGLSFFKEIE